MNSSQKGGLASNDPDTGLNSRIGLFVFFFSFNGKQITIDKWTNYAFQGNNNGDYPLEPK
jgi:hypothetical protein